MCISGKVFSKILIERMQKIAEGKDREEQDGFRTGKDCGSVVYCNGGNADHHHLLGRR